MVKPAHPELGLRWHPCDDPKFCEWLEEYDGDTNDFAYGLYDSKWGDLYETYKEDIAHGNTTI